MADRKSALKSNGTTVSIQKPETTPATQRLEATHSMTTTIAKITCSVPYKVWGGVVVMVAHSCQCSHPLKPTFCVHNCEKNNSFSFIF